MSAAAQPPAVPLDTLSARWRRQPGRLEAWYATVSDPGTSTACWVHHEMVAPVAGAPYAHGWAALFRPGIRPALERFGPEPLAPARASEGLASTADAVLEPPALRGHAGGLAWDLQWEPAEVSAPLFTFPAWAWHRELLPAAQVVPVPCACFSGTVGLDGEVLPLSAQASGTVAHIYGHGNAQRWAWLHAELGGGDVLEIVSAVSRRPGLTRLPPLAFVQLRLAGRDWPRHPVVTAPVFRTTFGSPTWTVRGTVGRWRLTAEVTIPAAQAVSLTYVDPDGATATCTNSELADADVVLEHRGARWEVARRWPLRGLAHAELGTRP